MTDVLVVAELLDGGLRKNTLSAVRFARDVASATGGAPVCETKLVKPVIVPQNRPRGISAPFF